MKKEKPPTEYRLVDLLRGQEVIKAKYTGKDGYLELEFEGGIGLIVSSGSGETIDVRASKPMKIEIAEDEEL